MRYEVCLYVALCIAIVLMVLETVDHKRWRWSLAGMLRFTLLAGVLLAIGRILTFVGSGLAMPAGRIASMNDDPSTRRTGVIVALAISLPVLAVIFAALAMAMTQAFWR